MEEQFDIQELIESEGLGCLAQFSSESSRIAAGTIAILALSYIAIRLGEPFKELLLILLISLAIILYARLLALFNKAVNDLWLANWRYASQILAYNNITVEEYLRYYWIEYALSKATAYGVGFSVTLWLAEVIGNGIYEIPLYIIAAVLGGLFFREVSLPHVRFYRPKMFAKKIERLRACAKRTTAFSVAFMVAFLVFVVAQTSRVFSKYIPPIAEVKLAGAVFGGLMLGLAISGYTYLQLEVSAEPLTHSPFSATIPLLIASVTVGIRLEHLPSWLGLALMMSAVGVSYVVTASSSLGFAYSSLTDVKRLEDKEWLGKIFDSQVVVVRQQLSLLGASAVVIPAVYASFQLLNAPTIAELAEVAFMIPGILLGLLVAGRGIVNETAKRIHENRVRAYSLKRKVERRREERKARKRAIKRKERAPSRSGAEEEKEASYTEEDLDKWLKLFEKIEAFEEE